MNYYIICVDAIQEKYLVKANTKKEAKEIIWNKWFRDKNEEDKQAGYSPIYKNEIDVYSLKDYEEELKQDGFAMLL